MADISVPPNQTYYRIAVQHDGRTMYYNRIHEDDVPLILEHAESRNEVVSHITKITVEVQTWDYTNFFLPSGKPRG